MLTVLVAAKRASHLSLAEFTHYWMNEHAPLVLSVEPFARHLRRYVIYALIDGADEGNFVLGRFPGYDGIGELRFDNLDAMKSAFSEPDYLEIILVDENKFLDREACLTFFTTENVQKELVGEGPDALR